MEFDLDRSIEVLGRTPAVLSALLGGLAEPWIRGTEGPDTFSPFDVVGHLIDGEETDWIPRARIILAQGADRRFEPYDRFRHRARNAGRPLSSLLEEFARLRAANIEELRAWQLTAVQLDLTATHPDLGPVTLRQLLATWVTHDLGHLAQVARVMAKQYRGAVGPWLSYLPVLTDREPQGLRDNPSVPPADRSLITSRLFSAPVARVFEAFADPRQLAQWWGPQGFTNTFREFDLRAGGAWRFVMHGPDGRDYPNESVFLEVTPPRRVVFRHQSSPHFEMTIAFENEAGQTRVRWQQVFDTAAECERVARFAGAANEQNLDRLGAQLAQ
jgi:uncharacterized protein YndB with AHSA1/START domain